ncbi:MAG: hypothetical protein OQK78_09720 [Gammaproteobacteria bacterium]|nr:hypothetical protein [Gammaproteobacteria bacterium]
MKHSNLAILSAVLITFSLNATQAWSESVNLRYKFDKGASYQVKQLHHDKGRSVTEMDMMGQKQKFDTPHERTSNSSWVAKAVGQSKGGYRLMMTYGKHKGGERWANPGQSGASSSMMFNDSKAEAVIDPVKGLVSIKVTPKDDLTSVIYQSRFGWLPKLPKKALKVGEGFEHEYTFKSKMMNSKRNDEYFLDEISGGMAYFSVESKELLVYNIQAPDMSQMQGMQGMQGMMPQQPASKMKMVYKGDGTAIFDIKQGMFVEWEVKRAYKMPTSSMMGMTTTMQGVVRERWEMERR